MHGRFKESAYIEYDWRLSSGKYKVLERLGDTLKSPDFGERFLKLSMGELSQIDVMMQRKFPPL